MIWKATHSSIKHEVKKKVNAVKQKSYCMARQEKFEHKMFLVLWPSLSLHCVLRICVMHRPDLPISRNTCSAVIKSTILASARQLLKDNIPWEPEGSRDLPLCSCRPGLCELSRMSQKTRTRLARCGTVLRPFREALPRSKSSVWLKYNVVSFLDRLMNFFYQQC